LVASGLAAMRSCKNRDDYFLWGMVHDLGRLILLTQLPETYAKVWEVAEDLDAPLDVVEARLLNMDHCSVLAHALEHWQFPREFLAPVVNHHQPVYKLKRLAPRVLEEAMTISLADKLAHALMLGDSGNGMLHPLDDLLNELKLSPSMVEELIRDIPEQAANLRLSLMSRSHVDEWPVFLDRARSRLRSAFRPLCVAMEPRTASVKMICDRLSAPGGESDPNLGILYLRDVREQPSVIARFEAVEKESEIDALPVIVLWDKGRMESEHAWLKNRRHLSFQLPIRFSTFLDSVNSLMG